MVDEVGHAARPTHSPHLSPASVLSCVGCGKKNRIRPSDRGAPHCGACGKPLAWLVNATDATFAVEADASVPVVVDLWAPWCGPCRIVGPMLEDLSREFAGKLKVVKVNVDENQRLAVQYDARSIPTLLIMNRGRVVERIVGALPKDQLRVRLTPHLLASRSGTSQG